MYVPKTATLRHYVLIMNEHFTKHYWSSNIYFTENVTSEISKLVTIYFTLTLLTASVTIGAGAAYSEYNDPPPPLFSGVRVAQSLVFCVVFCGPLVSFCSFSFGHCVVCSSILRPLITPLV